ncbi:winged helix-turn-helix domain-containing protein [Shewanella sp. GXUN23E]|uniref:winged helix-turn-helix domain-containing protein n=1 Tax=Shewanella sp. GXUN23E TaxID=3422498 RepID=UPI003D7CC503
MYKLTKDLFFDLSQNYLLDKVSGEKIELTASESNVLAVLLDNLGHTVTRQQLLDIAWKNKAVATGSLTQCISTLRKKLNPYEDIQLNTLARLGYQLEIDTGEAPQNKGGYRQFLNKFLNRYVILSLTVLGLVSYWISSCYLDWHTHEKIPFSIGDVNGTADVIYYKKLNGLDSARLENHLSASDVQWPAITGFNALYAMDKNGYSLALCPEIKPGECISEKALNISYLHSNHIKLDSAIRQIYSLPAHHNFELIDAPGEHIVGNNLMEHDYQASIYFPLGEHQLEQYKLNMAFIYDSEDEGTLLFYSALTESNAAEFSMKYRFRGHFEKQSRSIDSLAVDVFHIQIEHKVLDNPESIGESMAYFFRRFRRSDISEQTLDIYRIKQSGDSALWMIPKLDNFVFWSRHREVRI